MSVSSHTAQHIDDHLVQAEFALKVASNFDCLKGTPAHDAVCVALAQVVEAKSWVRQNLAEKRSVLAPAEPARISPAEQHRIIQRRMARLAP